MRGTSRGTHSLREKESSQRRVASWTSAALLLAVAAGLAGCGAGSEALPSNLPGIGGGIFAISTTTIEDGVINRSYSKTLATTGGTAPVAACTISAGALPGGMTVTPSGTTCVLAGTPSASGTFTFTVQASDSSVPVKTDTQAYTLIIRAEFLVTSITGVTAALPLANRAPDGVQNRAYDFTVRYTTNLFANAAGNPAGDVGQSAEFGNGPIASCTTVAVTGLPAGLTATQVVITNGNTCDIRLSGTITAAPATFANIVVTVTDTAIPGSTVPAKNVASVILLTLRVNTPMTMTLNFDAAGVAPEAVQGRTYGAPTLTDLKFTVTGGLGPLSVPASTYSFAVSSPALPIGITCTQTTTTVTGDTFSCNSSNVALPITSVTSTFGVTVTDDFTDTNKAVLSFGLNTDILGHTTHTIVVNAALALAINIGTLTNLPDGANLRAWGTGVGCTSGACVAAIYNATGGLGKTTGAPAYIFTTTTGLTAPGAGFPSGMACTQGMNPTANQFTCSAAAISVVTPGIYTPSVTANDVANQTTQSGAASATTAVMMRNLNIFAALAVSFSQVQNLVLVANPATLLDGVISRTYGLIGGAPTYTATGGLGGGSVALYQWCYPGGKNPYPAAFTPAVSTNCAAPTSGLTNTFFFSSASATPAATTTLIALQVQDTGNGTAPVGNATTTDTQIIIRAALAVAFSQSPLGANPVTLLDGVDLRSYGVITANAGAPTYTATGGLGVGSALLYRWCYPVGKNSYPAAFTPAVNVGCAAPTGALTGTFFFSAASATPAATTTTIALRVDDTGNDATPIGTATTSDTQITIRAILAVAFSQIQNLVTVANPATLNDGVTLRSYGVIGGGAGRPTYTASGGLGSGSAALYSWCYPVGKNSYPAGFTVVSSNCAAPSGGLTGTVTFLANPTVSAAAGTTTLIALQVQDTGNAATPIGTATTSDTQIIIRAALAVSFSQNLAPNPATLLDGVISRSYGVITANAGAPTYTATGGLGVGSAALYQWCYPGGKNPYPAAFTPAVSTNCAAPTGALTGTFFFSSASATPAATTTLIALNVQDTGNDSTPVGGATTSDTQVTIRAALTVAFSQVQNLVTVANPATLNDGVTLRSYGLVGGAPIYAASGGLGVGSLALYRWCYPVGKSSFPGGFGPAVNPGCGAPTGGLAGAVAFVANPMVTAVAGTTTLIAVRVDDTGNAATPIGTATTTDTQIIIRAALTVAFSQAPLGANPATLLDGVISRSYGVITANAGAPTYTATGGLGVGSAALYQWCYPGGKNPYPAAFTPAVSTSCAAPTGALTGTFFFSSASATPAATTSLIALQVQDTGNDSTPVGNATTSDTQVIIRAVLAVAFSQATLGANPATLLDGVAGQSYGAGGVGAPTYTATGGLGVGSAALYRWCYPAGKNSFPAAFTPAVNAGCAAPTGGLTGSFFFSASPATPAATTMTIALRVDDTGNTATPVGTATTTPDTQITIRAAMTFTLITSTQSPATTACAGGTFTDAVANAPDAVRGRTYGGAGTGKCDLLFQVTGGRPNYTWTVTVPAPGSIACLAEGATSNFLRCNSNNVALLMAAATSALAVNVKDTGNAALAQLTTSADTNAHASHTIAVRDNFTTIAMAPAGASSTQPPDGVTGRPYGTPGGANDLTFTVAGTEGLDPVVMTPIGLAASTAAGFPTNLACSAFTTRQLKCTTGASTIIALAATFPFTATAADTANDTTPAGSAPNFNGSVVINPELVIDNTDPLPSGVMGMAYSVIFTCNASNVVTGRCGGTGIPGNVNALLTWSSGDTDPAVNFQATDPVTVAQPGDATYSGIASVTGKVNVTIFLRDDGNATTPSCNTAPGNTCPGSAAGKFYDPFFYDPATTGGFVTNNGASNVRVINTTAPAATGIVIPIVGFPQGIAINAADPRVGYVANGPGFGVTAFCTRADVPGEFPTGCLAPFTPLATILGMVAPTRVAVSNSGNTFGLVADTITGGVFRIDTNPGSPFFNTVVVGFPIPGANDVAIRPQGDFACVSVGGPFVFKVDTALTTPTLIPLSIPTATSAAVAISPDGHFCYVIDSFNATTHVVDFDPASPTFATDVGNAGVGSGSQALALTPDGRYLLATEVVGIGGFVRVIDTFTRTVVNNIALAGVGPLPLGVGITADGARAFIADQVTNDVTPINAPFGPPTVASPAFDGANFLGPSFIATIPNASLQIQTTTLPTATLASSYSFPVAATGGRTPYLFTTDAAGLAALAAHNLTLSPDGTISSAAVAGATFSISVTVTDNTGPVALKAKKTVTLPIL